MGNFFVSGACNHSHLAYKTHRFLSVEWKNEKQNNTDKLTELIEQSTQMNEFEINREKKEMKKKRSEKN